LTTEKTRFNHAELGEQILAFRSQFEGKLDLALQLVSNTEDLEFAQEIYKGLMLSLDEQCDEQKKYFELRKPKPEFATPVISLEIPTLPAKSEKPGTQIKELENSIPLRPST